MCVGCVLSINVCVMCILCKSVCGVCTVYKCVWGVHIVYKCVFVCVSASWGQGVSGHQENLFFCPGALILTDSAMSTHFPQARWLTEPQENILLPPPSCPIAAPCEPHGSTESSDWVTASGPHILSVSQERKVSHPRRRSPRTPLDHVTLTNTRVGRRSQEFTADSPAPSCLWAGSQQNAALGAGSPRLGSELCFVGNLMQWESFYPVGYFF